MERSESTRAAMKEVLRPEYRIQMAATYEEALRLAKADPYDGIVVSLYDQDHEKSTELVDQLRARVSNTEVSIVAICGPALTSDPDVLLEEGFDDVLQMPFARTDLLDVLDRNT